MKESQVGKGSSSFFPFGCKKKGNFQMPIKFQTRNQTKFVIKIMYDENPTSSNFYIIYLVKKKNLQSGGKCEVYLVG